MERREGKFTWQKVPRTSYVSPPFVLTVPLGRAAVSETCRFRSLIRVEATFPPKSVFASFTSVSRTLPAALGVTDVSKPLPVHKHFFFFF